MLSVEKIKELYNSDVHFSEFVQFHHTLRSSYLRLNAAIGTFIHYNLDVEEALDALRRVDAQIAVYSGTLQDIYGIRPQNYADAYKVCNLEAV